MRLWKKFVGGDWDAEYYERWSLCVQGGATDIQRLVGRKAWDALPVKRKNVLEMRYVEYSLTASIDSNEGLITFGSDGILTDGELTDICLAVLYTDTTVKPLLEELLARLARQPVSLDVPLPLGATHVTDPPVGDDS